MKSICLRALVAAVLMTSTVSVSAAPQKPPRPTKPTPPPKPQPPTNPTPGEDFIRCVNDGNSVQFCMINFGG